MVLPEPVIPCRSLVCDFRLFKAVSAVFCEELSGIVFGIVLFSMDRGVDFLRRSLVMPFGISRLAMIGRGVR